MGLGAILQKVTSTIKENPLLAIISPAALLLKTMFGGDDAKKLAQTSPALQEINNRRAEPMPYVPGADTSSIQAEPYTGGASVAPATTDAGENFNSLQDNMATGVNSANF